MGSARPSPGVSRALAGTTGNTRASLTSAFVRMSSWMRCAALLVLVVVVSTVGACTSTQTSTSGSPSPTQKCEFTVTNNPSSFTEAGGTGTLAVDTTRDCSWSASSTANWVSISTQNGQGSASIPY